MRTLYIFLAAAIVSLSAGKISAQDHGHDDENCITGNAELKNIQYKVNNKPVNSLNGTIRENATVKVSFTIPQGSAKTRISLVSYTTPGKSPDYAKGKEYEVHDYETMEVGPGHHEFEVNVAPHFFEVNFVRGCVIWNVSETKNYEKEGRMIARGNGGTNPCHGNHRKVTICHVPKGNPDNAHTITISENAAKAHIGRHGGDYYGECRKPGDTANVVNVAVTCTSVIASSVTVNIETITLLLDDSSTQEFTINATTAMVSPSNEYEGYFVAGAWVRLEGETGEGTFYVNEGFEACFDTENPPLPVKLTKFEAKKLSPSVVQLNWTTSQEINNDYIAIEKSADITNWEEVCRVPGKGNSNHVHDYTCLDNNANKDGQNIVYYRPKQVDYNGTYEYFSTIKVRLQDAAYAAKVENVYPNPATDRLNIKYNSAENGIFNIRLISMDGKALLENQFVAKPGTQVVDINLLENRLDPGFYVLEIQSDNEVFRQKVYKQ